VARESEKIIAVSKSTKDDLISILHVPEEKIVVIPEGVEDRYSPQPLELIDHVKHKYNIPGEYLFSLSTLEPRKNQAGLIRAYQLIKKQLPDVHLVIAGRTGWGEIPKPVPGVIMTGYVSDADLPVLYSGAQVFVLPSFYEGFGLPPLQAMACGTPVVTSDISSLPEVVGEAGVLVDPEDIESIAAGIIAGVKDRRRLIKLGLAQAAKFTWEKAAHATYDTYRQVIVNK